MGFGLTLALLCVMTLFEVRLARSPDLSALEAIRKFEWDLALSQGNGLALVSISSTKEDSLEFIFPMPRGNSSKVISLDNDKAMNISHENLALDWPHFEVRSLISDSQRNLVYFSHSVKHHGDQKVITNLCAFNFTSLQTTLLLTTSEESIDDLNLYMGDVYFINSRRHAIMKVKTSGESFEEDFLLLPIVVKQLNANKPITGFAYSTNGDLYWSTSNPSTISYSTKDEEKIVLSTDLKKAHDLLTFQNSLYFINTPQFGPQRTIERLDLTDPFSREILINFEAQNQIPGTFTLICGTLYWTDAVSKALWKMDLPPNGSKLLKTDNFTKVYSSKKVNRHYNILFPYAVTSRQGHPKCESNGLLVPVPQAAISENSVQNSTWQPPHEAGAVTELLESVPVDPMTQLKESTLTPVQNSQLEIRKVEFCSDQESENSCLNGATCLFLEANLYCLCPAGYSGPKCELNWTEGVFNSSLESSEKSLRNCAEESSTKFLLLIATGLGSSVVALCVIVIILAIKVRRLSCNPKVHRRFIVTRPNVTTSRLPSTHQLNVCEMIDIENCCNMTICETPCYNTHTEKVSLVNGSKSGHDDKERLLDY